MPKPVVVDSSTMEGGGRTRKIAIPSGASNEATPATYSRGRGSWSHGRHQRTSRFAVHWQQGVPQPAFCARSATVGTSASIAARAYSGTASRSRLSTPESRNKWFNRLPWLATSTTLRSERRPMWSSASRTIVSCVAAHRLRNVNASPPGSSFAAIARHRAEPTSTMSIRARAAQGAIWSNPASARSTNRSAGAGSPGPRPPPEPTHHSLDMRSQATASADFRVHGHRLASRILGLPCTLPQLVS